MSRTPINKSDGWVRLAVKSCDFQNDSTRTMRYTFSAPDVNPPNDVIGYSLSGGSFTAVELEDNEAVWVKNESNEIINVEFTLWPE